MSTRVGLLVGLCVLVWASAAAGQAPETPKGFVGALAGASFGDQTSGVFGGQAGIRVGGGFHVIAEAGRTQNVLPTVIESDLEIVEALLGLESGEDVQLDARLRSSYAMGGLRWSRGVGRVTPFVEATAGVSRQALVIEAVGSTDLSAQVQEELRHENLKGSKFRWAAGGGVAVRLSGPWAMDFGYRYSRIQTEDPSIALHAAYGALKWFF